MKFKFFNGILCGVGCSFLLSFFAQAIPGSKIIQVVPNENSNASIADPGNQQASMFKFWKRLKKSVTGKDDGVDSEKEKTKKAHDLQRDIFVWFKTYAEVIGLVEKRAFRLVDFSRFIQDSLKSAVQQVDAHSAFFPPDSFKQAMESASGEFGGIGVSMLPKATDDDSLSLLEVIDGGPSDKAGLKSGDKIVEIEGEKIKGLSADEVVNKLKGKPGTKVSVKVLRDKKPKEITITRDIIKDQTSMCFFLKNQGIYYLSLKIFAQNSAQQVSELLQRANNGDCKGIILDLRRNPGGTLDSAIDMASLFLPKKSLVVVTKDNHKRMISEYRTTKKPLLKSDRPIFILVDNFTASAAEILAGTLQYYSQKGEKCAGAENELMVFLVGVPTFGKGSVQEVIPISNGCALKLTTMLYYLPGDTSIQAVGINPDFTIKPRFIPNEEIKWVNELCGKESSLKNFITVEEVKEGCSYQEKNLNKSSSKKKSKKKKSEEKEKSWEERQTESLSQDSQVQGCVNMINLLSIIKTHSPNTIKTRKEALDLLKKNFVTDDGIVLEKVK